jgi:hypothetical protein
MDDITRLFYLKRSSPDPCVRTFEGWFITYGTSARGVGSGLSVRMACEVERVTGLDDAACRSQRCLRESERRVMIFDSASQRVFVDWKSLPRERVRNHESENCVCITRP